MSYMGFPRVDEKNVFVEMSTGRVCTWEYTTRYVYHARVKGLSRSVCGVVRAGTRVEFEENEPGLGAYDRSRNTMTCQRCAMLVRKLAPSRNLVP